jgi:hypothetical protein
MFFPHHYDYWHGLAALKEDAVKAHLGDRSGFDMGVH